jgi:UMF1 family MFS transporter
MEGRSGNSVSLTDLLWRRSVVAWALYDCGNSAFATSVMVGFFPLFLNTHWSTEATGAQTTTRLMTANGIASLLLALMAPILGAIADRANWRKRFLAIFALCGALATASLYLIPSGDWQAAITVFVIASVGFAGANVFYDAMLIDVVDRRHFDQVSAFGYGVGYLGGGLLLAFQLFMVLDPDRFGLQDAPSAVRIVFPTVAVWWIAFSVPILLMVRNKRTKKQQDLSTAVKQGFAQLRTTSRNVRQLKHVVLFLAAYWLYIDGVNTVMKVAIDFGYKLGIARQDLLLALLIVQFISFPSALLFGWLGEKIGAKRALLIGLSVYIGVTFWAAFMHSLWEFYVLASAVGLVQGGVFSLSRSYYARLIPSHEAAEFFGFYNMIGKFAAVLGPLLVAAAAALTGSTRAAVPAVLPLILGGGLLLLTLPSTNNDDDHA